MVKRRVVVTGLGAITPVGNDVKTAWDNVVAGNSGIGPITHFDVSAYATRFGGEIRDFDISDYLSPKEAKRMDPFIHYGMAASIQALKDSGILDSVEKHGDRIGSALGAVHVETDMTRDLPEEQRSYLLNQVPLQRPGEPADVAAAVAFLASPQAAYITGETLHVNGGMYMG